MAGNVKLVFGRYIFVQKSMREWTFISIFAPEQLFRGLPLFLDMAKFVDQQSKDLLDALPLEEVMSKNGYTPVKKGRGGAFYYCPLHDDKDTPSLHVYRSKNIGELDIWKCHGCGRGGAGAITLEAALNGKDYKTDLIYICKELGKKFNVPLQMVDEKSGDVSEDYGNGFFHRARKVEAQPVFSLKGKDFDWNACTALGCKRSVMTSGVDDVVKGVRCSWGDGFEPWMLGEDFGVENVEKMVLPCKGMDAGSATELQSTVGDEEKSWEVKSTGYYPILAFDYRDAGRQE